MREFAPLPDSIPQSLKNVIAKALAKLPENRYKSAGEMREDLRRVLRGEAVSEFIQSNSRQNFSDEQILPTQKSVPFSAQNFHDENETVVRFVPSFGKSEKRKSSNVWMYATLALVLVSAIGLGVYFFANQQKPTDSNRNQVAQLTEKQTKGNLTNSENVNANLTSNSNIAESTPTPIPTPDKAQLQKVLNQYVKSVEKKLNQDGEEGFVYKSEFKDFAYGDIDKDGDQDAIVHIGFRDSVGNHITTASSKLVVFSNNNGQFSFTTDIDPGMAVSKTLSFKNGKIFITTIDWTADDPSCCPSIKNQLAYNLQGNRLERVKR